MAGHGSPSPEDRSAHPGRKVPDPELESLLNEELAIDQSMRRGMARQAEQQRAYPDRARDPNRVPSPLPNEDPPGKYGVPYEKPLRWGMSN